MTTTTPAAPSRALGGDGPLWQRIAQDLRERLGDGEFENDFPGEHAISGEYGVSRTTVRAALRTLRAEGLVTAHRGRPSRVVSPVVIEQSTNAMFSLYTSVRRAGHTQHSVVRALDRRVDAAAAGHLGLPEHTVLVHLHRVRFAGDQALAVDRVFLPAAVADPLLACDFRNTSLYGELRSRCGVAMSSGRERVRAAIPDPATRADLGIGADIATLVIERVGLADGRPVEFRETALRGDLFTLTNQYPSELDDRAAQE